MQFTTEQILALAPDAASAKAGQGLANARHWVTLGSDEQTVWGECQGSGKNPYQTQIDLSEPAFKCSCPSRKFPCKHGLGLLLLFANQTQQFKSAAQPAWVSDWFASRTKRAEQKAERTAKQAEEIADPTAQAKRAASREAKVTAGVRELELWLYDLLRNGLASPQVQEHKFWETPAKRMIDAQAPGLARLLQLAATQRIGGTAGYERMLRQLAKVHLLIEGYKRLETLPAETQADLRTLIGWTQNQDELLQQSGFKDKWFVLGQRVTEEDRLHVQATWLRGVTTRRDAVLLQYAHGSQPLDASWLIGSALEAELVFFASAYPLRALVKERGALVPDSTPTATTIAEAMAGYAAALAWHPWLERFPLLLENVIPLRQGERWSVCDAAQHHLPLAANFAREWELLALSGGHPVQLFGEWDGEALLPLSLWADGTFVNL
ncbi:MAG: SWIM zinc finger family protein [Blastocatellia bacterium]